MAALVLAMLASVVLVGCGGGGGGGATSGGSATIPAPPAYHTAPIDPSIHAGLTWDGTPGVCLQCHDGEARAVHASTHYQWEGAATFMTNGPSRQGKASGAVNSYCINIMGNWTGCGKCHVGLGTEPEALATTAQLQNIDCLICHQKGYKRKNVAGTWVPDTDAMTMTLDEAVRQVHWPTRETCLVCHAYAGGGDAVKRGDLAWAHASTGDRNFDVHMATTGANIPCQACHAVVDHRFAGKGSDLQATDLDVPVSCASCHPTKATASGHDSASIGHHVGRVACQTCHIPHYARNASDTAATEATETHRTWLDTHSTAVPYHPAATKANDLVPKYRFWDGYSSPYVLGDAAAPAPDTGHYATSRPIGSVSATGAKLYPFKYKTAEQPIVTSSRQLIALDTSVFFGTGDGDQATQQGLVNMGYLSNEPYEWVMTDTFQLLNHEVAPDSQALRCSACHNSTARMDLEGSLGYGLKGSKNSVCSQCHDYEEDEGFYSLHEEHVEDRNFDCSWCHAFSRPERGLTRP